MDLAESVVRSVDWSTFRISNRPATDFGEHLLNLLRSADASEARENWWQVENSVFSQDAIFSAAEPTIYVLLAALVDDRPKHVRTMVIELLFFLLHGGSADEPDLERRCRERADRGWWLLVREVAMRPEQSRERVWEVLELLDASRAEEVRAWLASS